MQINGLSASSLGCYNHCAWKFYLTQILRFEDESGSAAFLGSLCHEVLEVLANARLVSKYKESKIWDLQYLWDICFNHYYLKNPTIAEKTDPTKLKKICDGLKDLLYNSEYSPLNYDRKIIASEIPFNLELKEKELYIEELGKYFTLRGRIDRVDQLDEETLEILDWKSGSRQDWGSSDRHKKTPIDLSSDIQVLFYHLAAKQLFPNIKRVLVTLYYIVDGGPVTAILDGQSEQETYQLIRDKFKEIRLDNDIDRNISWQCKSMCSFGPTKSNICNKVWNERQENGLRYTTQKYTILNVKRK